MNSNTPQHYQDSNFEYPKHENAIDLRELFSVIWQGKWIILAITFIFAVGAVFYSLSLPNIYKSHALLAPAESQQQNGALASLAGQFGGLASMAGINLGAGSNDKTQEAIAVMKSREFIGTFIEKHQILPELMAAKNWNQDSNVISYDSELYNAKEQKWVRKVKAPFKAEPSQQEAYKVFMKNFTVSTNKNNGMVTVAIENISPNLAAQWVTWLVEDINQTMKQRDVAEATRGTQFLEQQLAKTNIADIRTVLYQLMEQAAKTIMFANVRQEYAFKTIDKAYIPEEKFSPKRSLVVILFTMLGLVFSTIYCVIRYVVRKIKK
ncbi:Wzz/FepE/Etk N-terminal domain-containing protein [Shewanella marina]|uniref:Wzz/FepE/Etk N-terminal domain-containing protein n=1 Tax=Shewanella marina TaxID=487319 RepID=UPI00046F1B76|nr:Wzz/FepE/Etk N-terminal domain-containing protein [Shewanella marina]